MSIFHLWNLTDMPSFTIRTMNWHLLESNLWEDYRSMVVTSMSTLYPSHLWILCKHIQSFLTLNGRWLFPEHGLFKKLTIRMAWDNLLQQLILLFGNFTLSCTHLHLLRHGLLLTTRMKFTCHLGPWNNALLGFSEPGGIPCFSHLHFVYFHWLLQWLTLDSTLSIHNWAIVLELSLNLRYCIYTMGRFFHPGSTGVSYSLTIWLCRNMLDSTLVHIFYSATNLFRSTDLIVSWSCSAYCQVTWTGDVQRGSTRNWIFCTPTAPLNVELHCNGLIYLNCIWISTSILHLHASCWIQCHCLLNSWDKQLYRLPHPCVPLCSQGFSLWGDNFQPKSAFGWLHYLCPAAAFSYHSFASM